jgi:hypothetical protein
MNQYKGSEIAATTDAYGYPIDVNGSYIVDHFNSRGEPEYVTVEAWENSHHAGADADCGCFGFLFD